MSKSSSEAAAEPAVPTSSAAPPAAPAPANRDPGPTPAPARPTPTGPTPVRVWIIGVGAGITITGVGARIPIVGVGTRITIARIALRWACRRRIRISGRRISRIDLRRRRGVAGIIGLRRSRLCERADAKRDRGKGGCSNRNSPEPAPVDANEHAFLHPGNPENDRQRTRYIGHSACHPPQYLRLAKLLKCHRPSHRDQNPRRNRGHKYRRRCRSFGSSRCRPTPTRTVTSLADGCSRKWISPAAVSLASVREGGAPLSPWTE